MIEDEILLLGGVEDNSYSASQILSWKKDGSTREFKTSWTIITAVPYENRVYILSPSKTAEKKQVMIKVYQMSISPTTKEAIFDDITSFEFEGNQRSPISLWLRYGFLQNCQGELRAQYF